MSECDDDVNIMSDSKHNDSMLLLLVLYCYALSVCVGGKSLECGFVLVGPNFN